MRFWPEKKSSEKVTDEKSSEEIKAESKGLKSEESKKNRSAGKRRNIDYNKNRINIVDFKKVIVDKIKAKFC